MKTSMLALTLVLGTTSLAVAAQSGPANPAASPAQPSVGPVTNPRVLMLRLYVSDIERGARFYREVFGTVTLQKMGEDVAIMNFPGGAPPGIIMIESPDEARMNGSFVMQVPDVQATLARAAANGGTLMNTKFAQQIEGMPARSSHFTDPDGNLIEVLQIGGPGGK